MSPSWRAGREAIREQGLKGVNAAPLKSYEDEVFSSNLEVGSEGI